MELLVLDLNNYLKYNIYCMKNYEPALSKETLKTVDNKIKQSKKKRSKSLLGNRLENLSINSVCPYLTYLMVFFQLQ